MPFSIRFDVQGERQISRRFLNVSHQLEDLSVPFNLISKDFYEGQRGTFEAEGAFEGKSRWAELSPRYKEWKERHYPDRPILVLTGKLREAATKPEAEGSLYRLEPTRLEMGVYIPVGGWNLASLHQFGTSKMPARKIIKLTHLQRKRWIRIFRNWFWSGFGGGVRGAYERE